MMKHCFVIASLLIACGSSSPPPATPSGPMTGRLEHRMANCPNAVAGATTRVVDTADGVEVQISAADVTAKQRIRELSEVQAQQSEPVRSAPEHSGLHGGPGSIGHCPILHEGTRVTMTVTDAGATLHVAALEPARVKALQDETAARAAALASPAQP